MERRFSQRRGLKAVKVEIQTEAMDQDLRNGLWNALHIHCFKRLGYIRSYEFDEYSDGLATALWEDFFKLAFDTFPVSGSQFVGEVKDRYDSFEWFEVYDLIEFVSSFLSELEDDEDYSVSDFDEECNRVLEREISGYRLINSQISPNTSTEGNSSIEDAIKDSPDPVSQHLARALELFSDRESPDYRNSIKESISAIETLCRQITGKPRVSLGEALSEIERNKIIEFHPAFREACNKLYGWTNDEDGVRHSLMDESDLSQEDTLFVLVACSSFANYLIVKADKAGIELGQ